MINKAKNFSTLNSLKMDLQFCLFRYIQEIKFVTKTVAGFLDFVTTVGNTVMIFTPHGNAGKYLQKLQRI